MHIKVLSSDNTSLLFGLEEIKGRLEALSFDYDFLLFAISPKFNPDQVAPLIHKTFKTSNYAAFNAIHSFCDNEIVEKGVTLLAIKGSKISLHLFEDLDNPQTKEKAANFFNTNKEDLHILIATYNNGEFGSFIEELSQKITYTPLQNIIGGIASGELVDGELRTFLYTKEGIIKNGMIVMSFKDVQSAMDISLGFKPYGIVHTITQAQGSKIYKVDNDINFNDINFATVMESFFQDLPQRDIRYLWYAPLYMLKEEGYVATLRTIEDITPEYVKLFGPVKSGEQFKISFGTKEDLLQEDKKVAQHIFLQIGIPDLILNFSCIARQYVLEDMEKAEIDIYTNILNAHLFGFFTFGEIGPDKEFTKLKLYNETSLVVGIKS